MNPKVVTFGYDGVELGQLMQAHYTMVLMRISRKADTEQGSYGTARFLQEGERGVADQTSASIYVLITCCKTAE